jgi:hypothetical protein
MRDRPIDKIYTEKSERESLYRKLNECIEQVNMLTRTVHLQNETIRNLQQFNKE